ncbi:hypothetical protein PMAYCL1PPCAC_10774, partial [Pristionchus mayeri]
NAIVKVINLTPRMRLLLLLQFLPVLVPACLTGYSLVYDGQCFIKYSSNTQNYADAKNTCASGDSHLPQFYSQQDVNNFLSMYKASDYYWIGLLCDGEKFVWEDGTVANYTNFLNAEICDAAHVTYRYNIFAYDGKWRSSSDGTYFYVVPICVANVRSWTCDSYYLMEQGKSDDTCYLVDSKPTAQSVAEANCESQRAHLSTIHDQAFNDFVKRTAVGHGLTMGIFIGLKHDSQNDKYVWSDLSEVDYTNFAPGFPDETFGECVAMGINLFPGKWINAECSEPLPYICAKPALTYDDSVSPQGCVEDAEFYPGDEVFSPTWGSATGPALCDYPLMDLDKSKKVTVEILFFESNSCCDTLTIYDGLVGTKVLKTLTGYYGFTSINVTSTSNAIRMEWNAKSGAHVRGWHARVSSA